MLRPRLASSMHSPRRILVLLAGLLCLGYLVTHSTYLSLPTEIDFDLNSEHSARPPRPNYPPFQPPPLKENAEHKQGQKEKETVQKNIPETNSWSGRAESVKQVFLRAYSAYEEFAPFPNDELLPISNKSIVKYISF